MLNTFSRQPTKTIQGNFMSVSNFHMHTFTNVPIQTSCWPSQILFFPSYINFWLTVAQCLQSFLLLVIGNKPLSLLPRSAKCTFCDPSRFFFVYLVKLKIYFWLFYFHWGRKKREDNYLWQWIIEIFSNTQPYKLCTKRKTKTGEVLSREIT